MIKRFLLLVIALILVLPLPALAQEPEKPRFNALEVDLWPEYDRPAMLVIYRIALASNTSLPADLSIRIPASAGEPNAVASKQADGTLNNLVYQRQVGGEWASINFTADMPEIQLEYYDPGLEKVGADRNFAFTWLGDYGVASLSIQVQQPFGAIDLVLTPSLGTSSPGKDGLTYYTAEVGAIPQGQSFSLSLSYKKNSDTLSAENLEVEPSAPLPGDSGSTVQWMTYLPYALGVLGVGLIVGGVIWYWQSGKQKTAVTLRKRTRRPAASPASVVSEEGNVYCHNCGKRASAGDRFCRTCGTRLRTE